MESLCFDLFTALEQQGKTLKEMLAVAREHNRALRQNDLSALRDVIAREEKISTRLKVEDRQREQWQKALEKKLDLPAGTTISKLLPHLPEDQSAKLSRLAAELKNTVTEINGLVKLNSVLTRRAMHFNEQLLRLLKPMHNSTYQLDGKSASLVHSSSLINKTV